MIELLNTTSPAQDESSVLGGCETLGHVKGVSEKHWEGTEKDTFIVKELKKPQQKTRQSLDSLLPGYSSALFPRPLWLNFNPT